MRRLTLLLALLLTPAAAHAQSAPQSARWIPLPGDNGFAYIWIDGKTMRVTGATLDVWIKQHAGLPSDTTIDGVPFEYTIQHWLIHCRQGEDALIGATDYDKAGNVVSSNSIRPSDGTFKPYTPDSVGEFESTSACAIARKRHLLK